MSSPAADYLRHLLEEVDRLPSASWAILAVASIVAGCGLESSSDGEEGVCALVASNVALSSGWSPIDCGREGIDCESACDSGDAAACLARAFILEGSEPDAREARALYSRACRWGLALGCTNYAAGVWARAQADRRLPCAELLFERACEAGEPFGCGMLARLRLVDDPSEVSRRTIREHLEGRCSELGGFPCRVLAKHLEVGDFGEYPPDRIARLLEQACESGDVDACGEPGTAAETFH
jgi:hypothetical protein